MPTSLLSHPITRVWLLLAVLTALAWWLGLHARGGADPRWLAVALLALAFFKVRLVILHFMEIRHAPIPIRLVFEAWVVVVCLVVVALYWRGGTLPA